MRSLFFLLSFWLSLAANAQTTVSEHEMKAVYLFNLAMHTDWPENLRANFNICLLGDEEVGLAMRKYDERRINDQRVVIARLTSMTPIRQCQVLYVGANEIVNLPKMLKILEDLPVLTVTDAPNVKSVSMLLALENNRMVFDLNLEQCQRVNLKPQAKLLRMARNLKKP
jgi:hypothetical protein